jgi:Tol biopolymer transport system component
MEDAISYPQWSNDGTRIAFLAQTEGRPEVYVIEVGP